MYSLTLTRLLVLRAAVSLLNQIKPTPSHVGLKHVQMAILKLSQIASMRKLIFFSAKGTIRFLNNSKWIGKTSVGTSVGSSNLVTVFNDSSFQSMAEAKEYVLVADISRLGSYTAGFEGCMTVSQHRRPLIYAIPAVGVSVLLICEAIAVTFVCCCYFGLNKRKSETYQTL